MRLLPWPKDETRLWSGCWNENRNPRWSSQLIWKETCNLGIPDFDFYSLPLPFRISWGLFRNRLHYCHHSHTADPPKTSRWWFFANGIYAGIIDTRQLALYLKSLHDLISWHPVSLFSFLSETVCGEISACLRQWSRSSKLDDVLTTWIFVMAQMRVSVLHLPEISFNQSVCQVALPMNFVTQSWGPRPSIGVLKASVLSAFMSAKVFSHQSRRHLFVTKPANQYFASSEENNFSKSLVPN